MMMRSARRAGVVVALLVGLALLGGSVAGAEKKARGDAPAAMQTYSSPYYTIYSDLEPERVQEALLRMTRMAEEYHERTKEFSGAIRQKFPFYLFRNSDDYY